MNEVRICEGLLYLLSTEFGADFEGILFSTYTVGSLYYAELKLCEVIYQHIVLFNLCYHHR